jgi:hypothetical protein
VREFVARLNTGTEPLALLNDDAVVTVNGTTPLSGRYTGLPWCVASGRHRARRDRSIESASTI